MFNSPPSANMKMNDASLAVLRADRGVKRMLCDGKLFTNGCFRVHLDSPASSLRTDAYSHSQMSLSMREADQAECQASSAYQASMVRSLRGNGRLSSE